MDHEAKTASKRPKIKQDILHTTNIKENTSQFFIYLSVVTKLNVALIIIDKHYGKLLRSIPVLILYCYSHFTVILFSFYFVYTMALMGKGKKRTHHLSVLEL